MSHTIQRVVYCASMLAGLSTLANAQPPAGAVRGRYCSAVAPAPGWMITFEDAGDPARAAVPAMNLVIQNIDQVTYAAFDINPAGRFAMGLPWHETPERVIAGRVTGMGTNPARFGNPRQLAPGVFLVEWQSATRHGVTFYEVFPAGPGGYLVYMRSAETSAQLWRQRGPEAVAVAKSIQCSTPNFPPHRESDQVRNFDAYIRY